MHKAHLSFKVYLAAGLWVLGMVLFSGVLDSYNVLRSELGDFIYLILTFAIGFYLTR